MRKIRKKKPLYGIRFILFILSKNSADSASLSRARHAFFIRAHPRHLRLKIFSPLVPWWGNSPFFAFSAYFGWPAFFPVTQPESRRAANRIWCRGSSTHHPL